MDCGIRAVGNKNNPPFTEFTNFCWNVNCPKPGNMGVEFLELTLQLMNCTLEVVPIDLTADQTIDFISNGTADISLLALRQTLDRMERVDFTQPVNFLYYGYMLKEIPQLKVEDYILASFQLGALLLLAVTGLVVGTLIWSYTNLFRYREGSLFYWLILPIQAFLNQFNTTLKGPIAAHVLVGFWLYFCMLITSSYQAKLKSFLTLSHARGTLFTDLDGLIDAVNNKGYIMVYEYGGYTPFLYCKPDQCDQLRKIPKNKIVLLPKGADLDDEIAKHNKWVTFLAWTYDVNRYPISYINVKKKLLFVRDSVAEPDYLAFAVNKDNPKLREQFNVAVLTTTPGYPNTRARYMREFYPYVTNSNVREQITVLRLSHLTTLFRACGEILALALIALAVELALWRFGFQAFVFLKMSCCCCSSFRHKLHITKSISSNEFPRRQIVVLPMRRSASPPPKQFHKFSLSPIPSAEHFDKS